MAQYNVALKTLDNIGNIRPKIVSILLFSSNTPVSTTTQSAGTALLGLGSTTASTTSNTNAKLHTLDVWSSNTTFVLEASLFVSSTSYAAFAVLWDFTTNSAVTSTAVSTSAGTTATSTTTVRSAPVSLIPGHTYGVSIYGSGATAYCSKASLVAFPA